MMNMQSMMKQAQKLQKQMEKGQKARACGDGICWQIRSRSRDFATLTGEQVTSKSTSRSYSTQKT